MATDTDVTITWAPRTTAELVLWVDDGEAIPAHQRRVFRGSGRLDFTYPNDNTRGFHTFEWLLVFPDKTLRDLKVSVSFDGNTFHTVGAHKAPTKNKWVGQGVAP